MHPFTRPPVGSPSAGSHADPWRGGVHRAGLSRTSQAVPLGGAVSRRLGDAHRLFRPQRCEVRPRPAALRRAASSRVGRKRPGSVRSRRRILLHCRGVSRSALSIRWHHDCTSPHGPREQNRTGATDGVIGSPDASFPPGAHPRTGPGLHRSAPRLSYLRVGMSLGADSSWARRRKLP